VLNTFADKTDKIYANSQGAYSSLPNGNVIMGYGQIPKIKEFGPAGDVRMTIKYGTDNLVMSYRLYRETWSALPADPPVVYAEADQAYMSWNGATDMTDWVLFVGDSESRLKAEGKVARTGFETVSKIPANATYVQIAAYQDGLFLRNSSVVRKL
jgi:Arylsulfotransferase (ASST)